MKPKDLTGQRFGRMTVIRKAGLEEKTPNGVRHAWLCRRDCGNEKVILAKSLKPGDSTSCGCFLKPNACRKTTCPAVMRLPQERGGRLRSGMIRV